MCGIVGYVGAQEAAPILLDGLRRLEYRPTWASCRCPTTACRRWPI